MFDWRSRKAKALVRQSLATAWPLVRYDIAARMKRGGNGAWTGPAPMTADIRGIPARRESPASPKETVYISACVNAAIPGGWRYNGGVKEFNLLAKLLRAHGYDAYIVTYDGSYEPWLIEHQPTISIEEFMRRIADGKPARFVTSWAVAETFLSLVPSFHMWDMELHYTANEHFPLLHGFYRDGRIVSTAGISRTVQAWHMSQFQRHCAVIPNLIDLDLWRADPTRRQVGRIGYMEEGPHTAAFVAGVDACLDARGIPHDLIKVSGDEQACLYLMQTCDLFVNLNIGKDPFWGEGCPRTIIESMAAGCVNVSFDILGNKEVVIDQLNAVMVPDKTPDSLAETLAGLLTDRARVEGLRGQSRHILETCHTFERRWPLVRKFLDL